MSQEQGTGRTVWVMRTACGCPRGVVNAEVAPTQSAAWKEFFPRVRERDAAMDEGITFEHIGWDDYRANVSPLMTAKCPHAEVTS
jgi:hypothetical protein